MVIGPKAPPPEPGPEQGYVAIARIVKPHGIKGEIKVLPYSGSPENFLAYPAVVVAEGKPDQGRTLGISRARCQGRMLIVQLAGVETRQAAEALVGQVIWLHEEDFPGLAAGEYYWFQFEGMRVITEAGRELGSVAGLMATGAHDLLVIKGGGREYLVPVRDEFIARVDRKQGLVIVSDVPGLLDE